MIDVIRKALLAGIGMQEKAVELIDEMVKKGELSDKDGAKLIKEVSKKAQESGTRRAIQTSPMPPAPMDAETSYGPRRVPGAIVIVLGTWRIVARSLARLCQEC